MSCTLLVGVQNDKAILEISLVVSYKTKHAVIHPTQQLQSWAYIPEK